MASPDHADGAAGFAAPYDAPFTLVVDRVATGGAALGSGPDGRVVFAHGAVPGEELTAEATTVHRSRVEARPVEILRASPDRVDPPCRHARPDGAWGGACGGCDWQYIAVERQRALRVEIVEDCLRRLARLDPLPPVRSGPELPADGYRTTVRAVVSGGRAGYRRRRSHEPLVVDECVIAHPRVSELLIDGRFGPSATEVVIRVGANSGERMVVIDPAAEGVVVPDDVVVVGRNELTAGRRPHIHEELGGLRLQISADSFFQCRPDGALAMARVVGDLLAPFEGPMLDAYCGVGLFGALAAVGRPVIGVESNPSAAADARWNLRPHGRVVESTVERWEPEPVGVVVADPARTGLKAAACDRLVATGAAAIALVSCDPASLARDTMLLGDRGFGLESVTVLDLFGHTSHIETISLFARF
ncbi:MAG: hypothetical protein OES24_00850 [Acidimicrobiia bacterium]|nr:hypothetical protein [Acidimicrobiia bacterium]